MSLDNILLIPGLDWTPRNLFRPGDNGLWQDMSNFGTLRQLSTGSTLVSSVGDPIGYIADSGPRGHLTTQTTNGKRPILSRSPEGGVRQLLTNTDILSTQTVQVLNAQHTLSFRGTGTITLSGVSTAGPLVGTGVNDIVTLTFTPTAGNLTLTVSGTCEVGQLELGAARTTYQKATTRYNITEAGKRDCWAYGTDGIDDAMSTPSSVDMSGSDEMTVCVGMRKFADIAGSIVESSAASFANNGSFQILSSVSNTNQTFIRSNGTNSSTANAVTAAAPASKVFFLESKIGTPFWKFYENAVELVHDTNTQGTGNFGDHRIYFDARAETSLFFQGLVYQRIIINRLLTDYEKTKLQQFVARKMGITL